MSKITCGVCGTRYPDSAEQCPICGCVRSAAGKTIAESVTLEEETPETYAKVRGGRFSKNNVRKRGLNPEQPEAQPEAVAAPPQENVEETAEPEKNGSNGLLNFLLVVVIIALVAVTAYIGLNHFAPDLIPDLLASFQATEAPTEAPTEEPTEAPTAEQTEEPTEEPTEDPGVPCTGLLIRNNDVRMTLEGVGQSIMLDIVPVPEDCTDALIFASSDEAVVTVDADGVITAVGEGDAYVIITCGAQQVELGVSCTVPEETEAPTEETEAPTEVPEETQPAVELRVDRTDMTFRELNQQTYMKLYNGLSAKDVTWTSKNEGIVTVNSNGLVTCVGWGTTRIIATYGDQKVEIICRCVAPVTETVPGEESTETAPTTDGATEPQTEATEAPVAEETVPATEAPVTEETVPATEAPVTEETVPATEAPVTEETVPATEAPVTEETVPATEAPVAEETVPATEAPVPTETEDERELTAVG